MISIVFEILPTNVGYSLPCEACDQVAYVALAQSIAVGNPIGEHFAYKGIPSQKSFIYPAFVAFLHWITKFDVIKIYGYGAAFGLILILFSYYFFGSPSDDNKQQNNEERKWEGFFMAFCFLYLTTKPMAYFISPNISNYSTFWNTLILLKPGHLISYAFIPISIHFLAQKTNVKNITIAGLSLGMMINFYILTSAFFICSFFIYTMVSLIFYKKEIYKKLLKFVMVLVVAAITSLGYWLPILKQGFTAYYNETLFPTKFNLPVIKILDPFENTFFSFPLFWFGVIGIIVMLIKRRKGDLLILTYVGTIFMGKYVYGISFHLFGFAPYAIKLQYFYLDTAMAIPAGIGLYSLAKFIVNKSNQIKKYINKLFKKNGEKLTKYLYLRNKASVAALLLFLLTPYVTPIWHFTPYNNWAQMGQKPLGPDFVDFMNWIKNKTQYDSIILADNVISLDISAYTGRKLMKQDKRIQLVDYYKRLESARIIYDCNSSEKEVKNILKKYNISYVIWTERIKEEISEADKCSFDNRKDIFKIVYSNSLAVIYKVISSI